MRGILYTEHELLGADFVQSELADTLMVSSYTAQTADSGDLAGAVVSDLTGTLYLYLHGADANDFIRAAFCSRLPEVGEARFMAALSGTGQLISVALVARSGDFEYIIHDLSQRSATLLAWLEFLAHAEHKGHRLYPQLQLEDACDKLCPLALSGAGMADILKDFTDPEVSLPAPGALVQLNADGVAILSLRLPFKHSPATDTDILYIPPIFARHFWRNFLSFSELAPLPPFDLWQRLAPYLPWACLLKADDRIAVGKKDLQKYGLLRDTSDFIGSRGL